MRDHWNKALGITGTFVVLNLILAMPYHAQADQLVSHRAVYGMKLQSASRGSGISGAQGAMIYSFHSGCDGWSSETNVKLQLLYVEGDTVATDWSFASWEARDGKSYQFRTRQSRNGVDTESLKGRVTRASNSDQSDAKFSDPEGEVIALPSGTLFPTRHLEQLLAAGQSGKKIFSRTVFDGASMDNPYEINAVVAKRSPLQGTERADELEEVIRSSGFDPMDIRHYRLAFFARGSQQEAPEFELGVDYRADGLARFIRQDFGTFIIDLGLEKVEELSQPTC